MVKFKKLFILLISLVLISSMSINAFALPDVSHSCFEDDVLLDTTWYYAKCRNESPTCEKHILRYESVGEFIKYLEENLAYLKSQSISIFLKRYLSTTLVTLVTGAAASAFMKLVLSSKSITPFLALGVSGVLMYVAKPIRNLFSTVFISMPRAMAFARQKFSKEEHTTDEKGLLNEYFDSLLDTNDAINSSLNTDKEIYKAVLESLKYKISKGEYLDNDILIVSWDKDPQAPSFSIKFDVVGYSVDYDEDKSTYFNK